MTTTPQHPSQEPADGFVSTEAAEWGHKDVELAAHDLLQYLDRSRS